MKINDIPQELWEELGSTKERLKYLSKCNQTLNNYPETGDSSVLVQHEDLDNLITLTYETVLDTLDEWLVDTEAEKYLGMMRKIITDRFERDFP